MCEEDEWEDMVWAVCEVQVRAECKEEVQAIRRKRNRKSSRRVARAASSTQGPLGRLVPFPIFGTTTKRPAICYQPRIKPCAKAASSWGRSTMA